MSDFLKLKKRREFLRVAQKGEKVVTTSLILQAAHSLSKEKTPPKFGFTTSKKIGSAVVRNKTRRRLRAAVRELSSIYASHNIEYVLIGRYSTATCPFADMLRDLKYAIKKAHKFLHIEKNETDNIKNTDSDN